MIALYIPFLSNPVNPKGCSVFNYGKQLMTAWLNSNKHVQIFFVMFEGMDEDEFTQHERVIPIVVPSSPFQEQYKRASHISDDVIKHFWPDKRDTWMLDCILNENMRSGSYLASLFNRSSVNGEMPILNFGGLVTQKSDSYYGSLDEVFDWSSYYGCMHGYNSFSTDAGRETFMKEATKMFKPSLVQRLHDRMLPNYITIDVDGIEQSTRNVRRPHPDDKEFVVQYAGRLASSNNFDVVIESVEHIYRVGTNVKFLITSQGSPGRAGLGLLKKMRSSGLPFELKAQCPRDEFWKLSATSHINIKPSTHGEFSGAMVEQITAGSIPIMAKADYTSPFQRMGYPYIYGDVKDLPAMYRFVQDNYWTDEVQIPFKKLRDFVLQEYRPSSVIDKLMTNAFEPIVQKGREITSTSNSGLRSIVEVAINAIGRDTFTWDEFCKASIEASDTGVDPRSVGFFGGMNKLDYHRALGAAGFEGMYDKNTKELTYSKYA